MVIPRKNIENILHHIQNRRKVLLLLGARQVGKTTALKTVWNTYGQNKSLWINGDLMTYRKALASLDLNEYRGLIDKKELLIIDEAQNIENIGLALKILYDEFPNLQIIATGSSTLELADSTKESLAGRTVTHQMYPVSLAEMRQTNSVFELKQKLNDFILYGMYPEVLTIEGTDSKKQHLQEIVSAYLYKDILQLSNIKHSNKVHNLVQLLAFQVGSLVSIHELSQRLQLNHETVSNYIDLLEKGFVIFRLKGLSNNPRNEISKMEKYYFLDTGIRNAVIQDFTDFSLRQDRGALWENFIIMERIKYLRNQGKGLQSYFWRRYTGAEIDWVEQSQGTYQGYEIKLKKRKGKPPKSWDSDYSGSSFSTINTENFTEFILD